MGSRGALWCLAAPCLEEQTPDNGAWRWLLWVWGLPPCLGCLCSSQGPIEQIQEAEPNGADFPWPALGQGCPALKREVFWLEKWVMR